MEENNAERVVTTVHKSRDAVFLARTKAPVCLKKAPDKGLICYLGGLETAWCH